MDELREYLNSLDPPDQAAFAARCGTTIGYLRKAIYAEVKLGESIVIAAERESGGKVKCESMRPDVDWKYLRGTSRKRA